MSEIEPDWTAVTPEEMTAVTTVLQEANPMDNPTLTVIGILNKGTDKETKLVKADWSGVTTPLSPRTISALEKLGINVNDNEQDYVF